ncbi:MAG TPA: AMP-binding protein [Mycobacteriales bacterium]|nr:AMP-binding protein [Mycobacteriales bacterium]
MSKPEVRYADRPWLASYPPEVPTEYEFPEVPLTRLLDDAAAAFPTTTALAFLGSTLTYRELKDSVDRFAAALAGLGVVKGDRVAIVLPNCPQNVITFFAALRLGAIVVQHNPLYTEKEMGHQLADSGAKVVVCLDKVYETVAKVRTSTAVEHVVVASITEYLPAAKQLLLKLPVGSVKKKRSELSARIPGDAKVLRFLPLLKSAKSPARQAPIDARTDLALLQYTGGTTGLSKGAMLTHFNLVANAYQNRLWFPDVQAGKEVTLAVLPLFHAYGLTVCMNNSVLLGGTLVLLPRFDLDLVFAAIDEFKPTLFPGVPPIYKAMTDSPKVRQHDLKSIKACISGAMKLPVETQEQFERISGGRLVEGYGMTETSPSTHANPIFGKRKAGTIGLPLPGTECRVVDQDDATRDVPVGEPGELAIRGPQVFVGYWNKPEETAATLTKDGWILTGDVAVMDDEGYFAIVDRKKELIIAGGFNIYPSEVEEVLFAHPGVADAVVVGLPDKYRGETVKAYVVAKPGANLTEQDVVDHCATSLTAYKVPKVVEFRDALPRTVVGKVLRRVLLEEERVKAEAAEGAEAAPARTSPAPVESAPVGSAAAAADTPQAKKPAAKKPAAKKPAAQKAAAAKKPAATTPAAKKPAAKKAAAAKKPAAKKPAARKAAAAKKPAAKKATAAKRTAAKPAAKKAAAKKTAAKKPAAKPARKR